MANQLPRYDREPEDVARERIAIEKDRAATCAGLSPLPRPAMHELNDAALVAALREIADTCATGPVALSCIREAARRLERLSFVEDGDPESSFAEDVLNQAQPSGDYDGRVYG